MQKKCLGWSEGLNKKVCYADRSRYVKTILKAQTITILCNRFLTISLSHIRDRLVAKPCYLHIVKSASTLKTHVSKATIKPSYYKRVCVCVL